MKIETPTPVQESSDSERVEGRIAGLFWAVAACGLTTAVAVPLRDWLAGANLILLYLLAVVLVTVRYGLRPGMLASLLAVLVYDVFLIPPYLSIFVADPQYLLTLTIMLSVSVIISHLTANLRRQARIAQQRERRAIELFELSKELSGALTASQINEIGARRLNAIFNARTVILVPGEASYLQALGEDRLSCSGLSDTVLVIATLVFERDPQAGGEEGVVSAGIEYIPLRAPMRTRGVLLLIPNDPKVPVVDEQQRLLRTCSAQIALAIERVHYVEVAQRAVLGIESEKLRNTLLSALSHDIRTPLTAIVGLSNTLVSAKSLSEATRREVADEIHTAALAMSRLVSNLLDMARLQGDVVKLNREWQLIEEVVGAAIEECAGQLSEMHIEVLVPASLPLLDFDAVLIERVIFNLLDNAAKYAKPGGFVGIRASMLGEYALVAVYDRGPGIRAGTEADIFAKFERGVTPGEGSGVGLGLSICKAIVEAHGGRIWADNNMLGGAQFTFSLPLGSPPSAEETY